MANRVFVRGEYSKSVTLGKNVAAIAFVLKSTKAHTLSEEQTNNLVSLAKKGDKTAANAIVEDNMQLVISIARSFQFVTYNNEVMDLGDLINEGAIGLAQAIENYNPTKGNFSNLACAYIRRAIVMYIGNCARVVRCPLNKQQDNDLRHDSLDVQFSDDNDTTKGDMLSNESDNINADLDSLSMDIARVLATTLTDKESEVLCAYFGIGTRQMPMWEIAEINHVTEERVRQLVKSSIAKIGRDKDAVKLLQSYL